MNCIFPKYMMESMIVYEVALGLFALPFQDWLVALNWLLRPEFQNEFCTFLWNSKGDKIKRSEMINSYNEVDLKMLDLKIFSRSLKNTWIQKYLDDGNQGKWKIFFDHYLKPHSGKLTFSFNIHRNDVKCLNM